MAPAPALVLAVVLVAVLVAVALSEAVLRLAERRLPPYSYWHDSLTTGKWHQLRALGPADVDVVVAGSSQALTGLDPAVVVSPPHRAYNAGLYRGVPTMMSRWLTGVVLPRTKPTWLVWGVSILDLNDAGLFHKGITDRYLGNIGVRRPWVLRVLRSSALVRRRGLLREPRRLLGLLRPGPVVGGPAKQLDELLGPMGVGLEYSRYDSYQLSDSKREWVREEMVNGFTMGRDQVQALREGVRAARTGGVRVVLVEMPSTSEFHEMYPRGSQDVLAARALLASTAAELGVPFLALEDDDLPLACFADCVHLNGTGMRRFSQQVHARLTEVMT